MGDPTPLVFERKLENRMSSKNQSSKRKLRSSQGLALAYKGGVRQELLPSEEEVCPAVPAEELESMEKWLEGARKQMEAHEQHRQKQ